MVHLKTPLFFTWLVLLMRTDIQSMVPVSAEVTTTALNQPLDLGVYQSTQKALTTYEE